MFDGAHRRYAHDRVAEPVARSHQDAERLQALRRTTGWQVNAALVAGEKKIWDRCFPAIVYPEPIFWRVANLPLNDLVHLRGQRFNRCPRFIEAVGDNDTPAADASGVNSRGEQCRAGPF